MFLYNGCKKKKIKLPLKNNHQYTYHKIYNNAYHSLIIKSLVSITITIINIKSKIYIYIYIYICTCYLETND